MRDVVLGQETCGLSSELTSFVGRRSELAEGRKLLADSRMVTLTGAGGVGKTRLGLRIAADAARSFPGGVRLVELADVTDERLIPPTVADTLGILRAFEPVTALAEFLTGRRVLLVLDNCEHLIDATAALAAQLLRTVPDLRILATSRQPLNIAGEAILDVPPLSLPRQRPPVTLGPTAGDAVTLFVERASAVQQDFSLSDGNSALVSQVCHRLDGIPLAIELAAVWLRSLSLEQIHDRLDDQLQIRSRWRAVPPRQRTLRAAIDWSYELCSPQEKLLWARLSVFSGGVDLEGAEGVCAGDGISRHEILDLLHALIEKSIMTRAVDDGGPARYRLLETLRQYGRGLLIDSGQEHTMLRRHRNWYQQLAEEADGRYFLADQVEWMKRLTREHANLRAAVEFSLTEPGGAQAAMTISSATWLHWLVTGALTEARHWLARALADDTKPSPLRAKALWAQGACATAQGDLAEAVRLLDESRRLALELGDETALAWTTAMSGWTAQFQGDLPRAVELLSDSLSRHRALGNTSAASNVTTLLGEARMWMGGRGLTWSSSYAMYHLAIAVFQQGDLPRAAGLLRDSARIQRDCHDRIGAALSLETLAWVLGRKAGTSRQRSCSALQGSCGSRSVPSPPASLSRMSRVPITGDRRRQISASARSWRLSAAVRPNPTRSSPACSASRSRPWARRTPRQLSRCVSVRSRGSSPRA
ncbi:ATP-binding protein [Streptomyces nigra]|uniref:ATP-binding protein n=1 Tax=Streptomyces nigra TaxID=1827580 RepID=UPI0037D3EC0D